MSPIFRAKPRLLPALAGCLVIAGCLASLPKSLAAERGTTQTVSLELQKNEAAIISFVNLSIRSEPAPFKKEPDFGGKTGFRGSFYFGGSKIGYLMDADQKKLCIDANGNQDLTDDPIYTAPLSPAIFPNVRLNQKIGAELHPVVAQINLYPKQFRGSLLVRSYWAGKVVLKGREWQIGVVENTQNYSSGKLLLLRPWEDREKLFSAEGNSPACIGFCKNLFFDNQAFQLNLVYEPGVTPCYKLEMTEQQVQVGEITLTGKYVQKIVLSSHSAKLPYTVVLDGVTAKTTAPVGVYSSYKIWLKEKNTEAFATMTGLDGTNVVAVSASKPCVLKAGGPLYNSVTVVNRGSLLNLNYRLIGAEGAPYQLVVQNRSKPPQFSISKSGKEIGAGNFEFG